MHVNINIKILNLCSVQFCIALKIGFYPLKKQVVKRMREGVLNFEAEEGKEGWRKLRHEFHTLTVYPY